MDLSVVVGNPKPQSRTLQIAVSVADRVAATVGASRSTSVVDLAEHSSHIFEWPSEHMAALNEGVRRSSVVVVASPTYKATYTGLLKSFLDRYSARALTGVIAIPVMTGASLEHAMAVEVNLRPLLVELGATVPTRGLYFVTTEMAHKDEIVADWADDNVDAVAALSSFTRIGSAQ